LRDLPRPSRFWLPLLEIVFSLGKAMPMPTEKKGD